jgi:hypothetical protein
MEKITAVHIIEAKLSRMGDTDEAKALTLALEALWEQINRAQCAAKKST